MGKSVSKFWKCGVKHGAAELDLFNQLKAGAFSEIIGIYEHE